jgi:tetratricopeptide (TPR) repeat protein
MAIVMIIPSVTQTSGSRLGLLGLGVVIIFLAALASVYAVLGTTIAAVDRVRNNYRFALPGQPSSARPDLDAETLRRALAAAPLSQSTFNALMVTTGGAVGPDRARWFDALKGYGWRHSASLQNRLVDAIRRNDMVDIFDIADALLRQGKLVEEASALVRLAETDPALAPRIVRALKRKPEWRVQFLHGSEGLDDADALDARLRTLEALAAVGDQIGRAEVAPSLVRLAGASRFEEAERLWRAYSRKPRDALSDGDFKQALELIDHSIGNFPFEWLLGDGPGYLADVIEDGLGGATMTIDWDGRGSPVLLSQRTMASPGRWRLTVSSDGSARELAGSLSFQLRCGERITPLVMQPLQPASAVVSFVTASQTPCSYPLFAIVARSQGTPRAIELSMRRISLEPVRN